MSHLLALLKAIKADPNSVTEHSDPTTTSGMPLSAAAGRHGEPVRANDLSAKDVMATLHELVIGGIDPGIVFSISAVFVPAVDLIEQLKVAAQSETPIATSNKYAVLATLGNDDPDLDDSDDDGRDDRNMDTTAAPPTVTRPSSFKIKGKALRHVKDTAAHGSIRRLARQRGANDQEQRCASTQPARSGVVVNHETMCRASSSRSVVRL